MAKLAIQQTKKETIRERALTLPAAQFFSGTFVIKALNCQTRIGSKIAEVILKHFVSKTPDITVADLLKSLDDNMRRSVLNDIGNKDSKVRKAFVEFCDNFNIDDFSAPLAKMDDKDYRLSQEAVSILEELKQKVG